MKLFCLVGAVASLCSISATVYEFDLEPGGLKGANQRPSPNISTATGGEIAGEPGISYDDTTKQLFLNFGWGSIHGYNDLNGSFLAARMYGPADENSSAGITYELTTMVNTQTQTDGGIFHKSLQLVPLQGGEYTIAEQEADLLAGDWYINIHSFNQSFLEFAGGEIRGQLVTVPSVPEPQSWMIAGLALAGCAWWRRWQSRSKSGFSGAR